MMFAAPKSIQATVTLLENLHVILEKTPREDIRTDVLPLLFNSFESNTIQIQVGIKVMKLKEILTSSIIPWKIKFLIAVA